MHFWVLASSANLLLYSIDALIVRKKPFSHLGPRKLKIDRSRQFPLLVTLQANCGGRCRFTLLASTSVRDDGFEMSFSSSENTLKTIIDDFAVTSQQLIPSSVMVEAVSVLRDVLDEKESNSGMKTGIDESQDLHTNCCEIGFSAARIMCQQAAESQKGNKKAGWIALQQQSSKMIEVPSLGGTVALCIMFGALALGEQESTKAVSSALATVASRNLGLRKIGSPVADRFLEVLLRHASESCDLNLVTLSQFAKSFHLTGGYNGLAPQTIRHALESSKDVEGILAWDRSKSRVNGALSLSCQLTVWPELGPLILVESSVPFGFWYSAEQVCRKASQFATKTETNGEVMVENAERAVESLIDMALEDKMYRLADKMATDLFKEGGHSRFLEARYYHACDTIAKVIGRGKTPIVERQVVRVDKAVQQVKAYLVENEMNEESTLLSTASEDIRQFALSELQERGDVHVAQRLAQLWGFDYVYDEETILAALEARRKKYLQFEEVLSGPLPDLIDEPQLLRDAFVEFRSRKDTFGFDAEWQEESKGVDVLQVANSKQALLLDMGALSRTKEGVAALRDTIGKLFSDTSCTVVGFSCSQDLSRLRAGPCVDNSQWIINMKAVVDLQQLLLVEEPKLKTMGLSRVANHYLGKPLDKSEQCSSWGMRPLSERQRSYAALDAWSCVGVYNKLRLVDRVPAS